MRVGADGTGVILAVGDRFRGALEALQAPRAISAWWSVTMTVVSVTGSAKAMPWPRADHRRAPRWRALSAAALRSAARQLQLARPRASRGSWIANDVSRIAARRHASDEGHRVRPRWRSALDAREERDDVVLLVRSDLLRCDRRRASRSSLRGFAASPFGPDSAQVSRITALGRGRA